MQLEKTQTSATPLSATATSSKDSLSIGRDAFLQLLLAQLKHQDPTKPMDTTAYVSQLAMLSNLEQSVKQSEKLDSLFVASALGQAAAIVGKNVESADASIAGTVISAQVTSDGIVAELASGQTLLVTSGVKVSVK